MAGISSLRSLVRDRCAGISIATACAMTMLIGGAALAVDVGSLYLDRRKLQGIADAAAMAAAGRRARNGWRPNGLSPPTAIAASASHR